MKAKEYFNQFLNENQDKIVEWRLVNAFRQMVLEVEQIAKMRSAKSDTALVSIFKEIETKSHSFIRLVNESLLNRKAQLNLMRLNYLLNNQVRVWRLSCGVLNITHNDGGMVSWGLDATTYQPSTNLINITNNE